MMLGFRRSRGCRVFGILLVACCIAQIAARNASACLSSVSRNNDPDWIMPRATSSFVLSLASFVLLTSMPSTLIVSLHAFILFGSNRPATNFERNSIALPMLLFDTTLMSPSSLCQMHYKICRYYTIYKFICQCLRNGSIAWNHPRGAASYEYGIYKQS